MEASFFIFAQKNKKTLDNTGFLLYNSAQIKRKVKNMSAIKNVYGTYYYGFAYYYGKVFCCCSLHGGI